METIIEVELKHILTNGNIRKTVDVAADIELLNSIEKHGLLSPLVVRKGNGVAGAKGDYQTYTLIAGHRRLAALKALERKTVPVQIVAADDNEALEIQITENLQRKDLSAMEEARAFAALRKIHQDWGVKEIAARADKSIAYVTRAMSLLTLADKTIGLIEKGELSPEIGHQIARVEGKQRETVEKFATTKFYQSYPTLLELMRQIEKTVEKSLDKAVFPKDVEKYGGTETPACVACPSNTGNQNVLFDGAQKGSCTNSGCYNKRTAAWYKEFQAKVTEKMQKLKFIGVVGTPGYMDSSERNVKGYPVIDPKKRKADIEKSPEKFGFAIQRPSKWDNKKMPEVIVVSLNKKDKAAPTRQVDHEKQRFVNDAQTDAVIVASWKKARALKLIELAVAVKERLDGDILEAVMAFEDAKDEDKFIKGLTEQELLWLLAMSTKRTWNITKGEWGGFGIDVDKIMAAAKKEAEAKWEADHKPATVKA